MSQRSGKHNTKSKHKHKVVHSRTFSGLNIQHNIPLLILAGTDLLFLYTRIMLLSIPLERDEGSFAYIGHWMLRGHELYTDLPDSKLPGLYTLYSVFITVFGYNATGVHLGLLLMNALTAAGFFLFVRELISHRVASIATALLLLLLVSPGVYGFAAHATQLLLPFVVFGLYLFFRALRENRSKWFFLSGLCIGIAFTIKQQAALYGVLMALMFWMMHKGPSGLRDWLMLGAGGFLPLIMILLYFIAAGRMDALLFWTLEQPFQLAGSFSRPWYELMTDGVLQVIRKYEPLWLAGMLGCITLWMLNISLRKKWFIVLFIFTSVLSIAIGTGYYRHYFVVLMPALALEIALLTEWVSMKTKPAYGYVAAALLILYPVIRNPGYHLAPNYALIHEEAYNRNMFPELEKIGKELKKRVPEGQRIAVLGSEPEVLVAAQRESCTNQLMVYSMFIEPETSAAMQEAYLEEIKACNAEYVVLDVFSSSWVPGFEKLPFHQKMIEWLNANHVLEGIAEFQEGRPGKVLWGDEARKYYGESTYLVYVMKRI